MTQNSCYGHKRTLNLLVIELHSWKTSKIFFVNTIHKSAVVVKIKSDILYSTSCLLQLLVQLRFTTNLTRIWLYIYSWHQWFILVKVWIPDKLISPWYSSHLMIDWMNRIMMLYWIWYHNGDSFGEIVIIGVDNFLPVKFEIRTEPVPLWLH